MDSKIDKVQLLQRSYYFADVFKSLLLQTDHFKDNLTTHFTASLGAGAVATTLTQPFDVLKTRAMNSKPGEFKSPLHLIMHTAKQGPLTFYKGYVPAFIRLGPHTILTFIFFEQLRLRFGWLPSKQLISVKLLWKYANSIHTSFRLVIVII